MSHSMIEWCSSTTYGENTVNILERVLAASLAHYNLTRDAGSSGHVAVQPHDALADRQPHHFVDIGCGRGKMVAAACVLPGIRRHFTKCVGVEILPQRVDAAVAFLEVPLAGCPARLLLASTLGACMRSQLAIQPHMSRVHHDSVLS